MLKLVLHPSFGWYLNHIQSHIFYHSNNQSQIEYESWLLSFCTPGKARSANALSSVLYLLNEHQQHRVMGFVVQTFLFSCCLFGSALILILRLSSISNFPHPLFPGSLIFWFPTCLFSYIPTSQAQFTALSLQSITWHVSWDTFLRSGGSPVLSQSSNGTSTCLPWWNFWHTYFTRI